MTQTTKETADQDIVERLRKASHWQWEIEDIGSEAADEIERLREALKNMSCSCDDECYYKYDICPHKMAANALKEKE